MAARDAAALAALRQPGPGESDAYAKARTALLAQEIELQRQIDHVAELRRRLPAGPRVEKDYRFKDSDGRELGLAELFGDKPTLVTYFWMYGPQRERPCPMCTNLLGPLNANANDLRQHVALAVLGRSPVPRQQAFAQERGWQHLPFFQTVGDAYALDFHGLDAQTGDEYPVLAVFQKRDDGVHLFWTGAMTAEMADEGKDPRGGPDFAPLWTVLDLTPEGRGEKWYPKLDYPAS